MIPIVFLIDLFIPAFFIDFFKMKILPDRCQTFLLNKLIQQERERGILSVTDLCMVDGIEFSLN